MSTYADSYQTVIGSAFVTKHIETEIKKLLIGNDLPTLEVEDIGKFKPAFITGYSDETEVPIFTHPITLDYKDRHYLCTDLRPFLRKAEPGEYEVESRIRNRTEYNFAKSRAVLNLIWLNRDVNTLKLNLSFAGIVFATWIADAVSRVYALDFKDQTVLSIIASFYYQTMFTDDTVFDEEAKRKMAVHTINATKAQADLVFEVFDKIESMANIQDFCSNVVKILENVRLEKFTHGDLITIVKNSWFGTNAIEIIAISLEHVPTWLAIVYTALNERTYKNSTIYKVAERASKRGNLDEFMKSYVRLVKEHSKVAIEEIQFTYFE